MNGRKAKQLRNVAKAASTEENTLFRFWPSDRKGFGTFMHPYGSFRRKLKQIKRFFYLSKRGLSHVRNY